MILELSVYGYWLLCYAVFFLLKDTREEEEQVREILSGRFLSTVEFLFRHAVSVEAMVLIGLIAVSAAVQSPWILALGTGYYSLGLIYVLIKRFSRSPGEES